MARLKAEHSKYRLILGDELLENFHPSSIKAFIKDWLDRSGALNVSSSVITATRNEENQSIDYGITFDSSCWTGRGFKGFHTKNRNFS